MDGEHLPCPIVENKACRVNLSDDEFLLVTASHDSIQMFANPDYTHLRYYDPNDGTLKTYFLSDYILAELCDFGIPITSRESITDDEVACYAEFAGRVAMLGIDAEIDELLE